MAVTKRSGSAGVVIPIFGRAPEVEDDEPEVGIGTVEAPSAIDRPAGPVLDLSGQAKVLFLIARGRSGKTLLARWLAETVVGRDGQMLMAALDQGGRRSLADFVNGVQQPPTSEPAAVARWLEALLQHAMRERLSALVDLGGGDTSLLRVLGTVPDLAAAMQEAEVAPVSVYLLGPSTTDLGPLATLEGGGSFRTPATLLVLNEGLSDPTVSREDAFGRVLAHSAFRSAVERGAVPVWMPRLDARVSQDVEAKRLHFWQAKDAVEPAGRKVTPLLPFDRSRVRFWLAAMGERFDVVRSWIP